MEHVNKICPYNKNYADKYRRFLYGFWGIWGKLGVKFCPHNYFMPFLKLIHMCGMVLAWNGMVKLFYKVRFELCRPVTTSICSCVGLP